MDNKDRIKCGKMFQEGDFPSPLKKLEKMLEMMRNCCSDHGGMADCCSMMKKMMRYGGGEESTTKKEKEV